MTFQTGFFKNFFTFISMPFKSDADIKVYRKQHPVLGRIAKAVKMVFTTINAYLDILGVNEVLKAFGKGFNLPSISQIADKLTGKFAKTTTT